jgi:hypothetical protein
MIHGMPWHHKNQGRCCFGLPTVTKSDSSQLLRHCYATDPHNAATRHDPCVAVPQVDGVYGPSRQPRRCTDEWRYPGRVGRRCSKDTLPVRAPFESLTTCHARPRRRTERANPQMGMALQARHGEPSVALRMLNVMSPVRSGVLRSTPQIA